MPAVPKLLADLVEPRFARPCRVERLDVLAPALLRVRFAGRGLAGLNYRPGQEVEFRVDDTAFRHYTPSAYDRTAGALDVIFYLHDRGPGSRWAGALRAGQDVRLLGPGGRFVLSRAPRHIFLGDETCLGVFHALARAAPSDAIGAIEVDPGAEHWPVVAEVPLVAATRTTGRGSGLAAWLAREALVPDDTTTIYLAGHADTIAELRAELRARGWSRSAIRTKPYWADGKRGL